MRNVAIASLTFVVGFILGMFGTLVMVIHEDTKRVLSTDDITSTYSTCGAHGKAWPVRSDGLCYMEDMPK